MCEEEYSIEELMEKIEKIKEISEEEYIKDKKISIPKVAKEIRDNAEIIIKNALSEGLKSMGAFLTIDAKLSDLGDEMEDYSTYCSEKELIEEKKAREEEVEEMVFYRDTEVTRWTPKNSEIATLIMEMRGMKKEEEEGNMFR